MPFRLTFPDGWVYGSEESIATALEDFRRTHAVLAELIDALLKDSPKLEDQFEAYNVGSPDAVMPTVGCNTVERGTTSITHLLDVAEEQNLKAIAEFPWLVEPPIADRIDLRPGETVRIKWRWAPPEQAEEESSVGYLFVSNSIVVTCVFSSSTKTVVAHIPEWEGILSTFEFHGDASASPAPTFLVDMHQAPEVEALLPPEVGGRKLTRWSVTGETMLRLWGADPDQIVVVANDLEAYGGGLEDLVQATAGRTDVENDPPYFVFGFRIPSRILPDIGGSALFASGFARPVASGDLVERTVGGKQVQVGPIDLVRQDEHMQGMPYIYRFENMLFVVITDDEAWAEDAIRQLP